MDELVAVITDIEHVQQRLSRWVAVVNAAADAHVVGKPGDYAIQAYDGLTDCKAFLRTYLRPRDAQREG